MLESLTQRVRDIEGERASRSGARWVEVLTCMVMCWLATGYWPQSHPCHTAWVSW